jgi:adenosine deaminase
MNTEIQPKIDLHRHLEGSIRPETILDAGRLYNLPLPKTLPEITRQLVTTHPDPDIMTFIEKLNSAISILVDVDMCKRIAKEAVEDAANDHIAYLELRFSPLYMSGPHNLPPEGVVEAVIAGTKEGEKEYNVRTNLIGILSRTFGVEACSRELDALLSQHDHVVALDLAGDEIHFPPELFINLFNKARDVGWRSCPHAGEVDTAESIWRAIRLLHADRLGHAVHATDDPKLMNYIAAYGIGIESNLTSNVQTTTVKNYESHPLKQFLQHGIRATINSDDPSISGITLSHELHIAAPAAGLTNSEIVQAQQNALDVAFLSQQEKRKLIKKLQSDTT